MSESTVFKGVVRGETIELDHEPGLPDGRRVILTVQTARAREVESHPPGEGLRRSAGVWADDAEELDAYLDWNRQERKQSRRTLGSVT